MPSFLGVTINSFAFHAYDGVVIGTSSASAPISSETPSSSAFTFSREFPKPDLRAFPGATIREFPKL